MGSSSGSPATSSAARIRSTAVERTLSPSASAGRAAAARGGELAGVVGALAGRRRRRRAPTRTWPGRRRGRGVERAGRSAARGGRGGRARGCCGRRGRSARSCARSARRARGRRSGSARCGRSRRSSSARRRACGSGASIARAWSSAASARSASLVCSALGDPLQRLPELRRTPPDRRGRRAATGFGGKRITISSATAPPIVASRMRLGVKPAGPGHHQQHRRHRGLGHDDLRAIEQHRGRHREDHQQRQLRRAGADARGSAGRRSPGRAPRPPPGASPAAGARRASPRSPPPSRCTRRSVAGPEQEHATGTTPPAPPRPSARSRASDRGVGGGRDGGR